MGRQVQTTGVPTPHKDMLLEGDEVEYVSRRSPKHAVRRGVYMARFVGGKPVLCIYTERTGRQTRGTAVPVSDVRLQRIERNGSLVAQVLGYLRGHR